LDSSFCQGQSLNLSLSTDALFVSMCKFGIELKML